MSVVIGTLIFAMFIAASLGLLFSGISALKQERLARKAFKLRFPDEESRSKDRSNH